MRLYASLVLAPFALAVALAWIERSGWFALPLRRCRGAAARARTSPHAAGTAQNTLLFRTVLLEVAFGLLLSAGALAGQPESRPVNDVAPIETRVEILPAWTDANGHMNVAYYVLAFDHATDAFYDRLGIGWSILAPGRSMFTLAMNVDYLRELFSGDAVRIVSRLIDGDDKRLHYLHEMYRVRDGDLAATNEIVALHVSMATRHSERVSGSGAGSGRRNEGRARRSCRCRRRRGASSAFQPSPAKASYRLSATSIPCAIARRASSSTATSAPPISVTGMPAWRSGSGELALRLLSGADDDRVDVEDARLPVDAEMQSRVVDPLVAQRRQSSARRAS